MFYRGIIIAPIKLYKFLSWKKKSLVGSGNCSALMRLPLQTGVTEGEALAVTALQTKSLPNAKCAGPEVAQAAGANITKPVGVGNLWRP